MSNADIIAAFSAKIQEIKQHNPGKEYSILPDDKEIKTGNRFVVVIDAISSMPGVLMPWKRMVEICKEQGLWSVVDAAHSIGQEVSFIALDSGYLYIASSLHCIVTYQSE